VVGADCFGSWSETSGSEAVDWPGWWRAGRVRGELARRGRERAGACGEVAGPAEDGWLAGNAGACDGSVDGGQS
jgi:hypothetical protein